MSVTSGALGVSEASEVTRIKLKTSNFSGSIAPQHQSATSSSWRCHLTYVCLHSDQHGGEANCSCVWAQTRANRSSNWAPVSLRYRWNRSSSRWSSWRRQWNYPSSVCLRRTSWTQTRRWVVFQRFWDLYSRYSAHWWYRPWSKRAGWEKLVQKWAGKRVVFCQAWQVRMTQMKRIVQNDQAARYEHLKWLHSRLSCWSERPIRQRPANWGSVLVRRFSASDGTLISASPAI